MKIQSLSIDVPAKCLNACHFCVSHMHNNDYENKIEKGSSLYEDYTQDFIRRLYYAKENGCNTVILTGRGEPLCNMSFLTNFEYYNRSLKYPFRCIELQTSGVTLDDKKLQILRSSINVTTISLSLSSIFNSANNAQYNRTAKGYEIDIDNLCKKIKSYGFNLRLSLNMTDFYNNVSPEEIIEKAKQLGADQLTFRLLYESPENPNCNENIWIREHKCSDEKMNEIKNFIKEFGKPLEILPFGATKYSLDGLSIVIDEDCMAQEIKDTVKYLILRPNCKLYSKWEDKASLIF